MHSLGKGVYINLQNQTDQQETIKNNKLFNHELSTSIRRHRMRVIKKNGKKTQNDIHPFNIVHMWFIVDNSKRVSKL